MSTAGNLSLDDWRNGRTLVAGHCDGCEHAAGWTALRHAATHHLDAPATAELLAMLGINPDLLKEHR